MMLAEVANHSKRTFLGEERGEVGSSNSMASKKPKTSTSQRNTSIAPKQKKDKVGDRVAALQQLVSPFGKTDTASVLEEASGYIKFLYQQLEVLSSPYLYAPVASGEPEDAEHRSLRSFGLCLMPVDLTIQLTQSNGADLWAPANSGTRR